MNFLNNNKVIIVDLFDSVLTQKTLFDYDIYKLLESEIFKNKKIKIRDLAKLKIDIEQNTKYSEIQTINKKLLEKLNIYNKDLEDFISQKEIELRISNSIIQKQLLDIINKSLIMNKKIFFIHNKFITKNTIQMMLKHHNIEKYNGIIYTPNDTYSFKKTVDNIISEHKLNLKNICFITSNTGTYENINFENINFSIYRTNTNIKNKLKFTHNLFSMLNTHQRTISSSILGKSIKDNLINLETNNHKLNKSEKQKEIGAIILGPLILGFNQWLFKMTKTHRIDNLLFLSRDGKIFYESFKNMFPTIKCSYIFASRKVSNAISINSDWDLERILKKPIYDQSLERYINHNFGINLSEIPIGILEDNNFNTTTRINKKTDKQKILNILYSVREKIFNESKYQKIQYKKYLNNYINKDENTAIVDIGYSGTMQSAMSEILDKDLGGFYISCNNNILNNHLNPMLTFGYLDNLQNDSRSKHTIKTHRHIYESLICCNEDSFEGFEKNSNNYSQFKFSSEINDIRKKTILFMHQGALDFCNNFVNNFIPNIKDFTLSPNEAISLLDGFLKNPPIEYIDIFEDIEFEEKGSQDIKKVLIASKNTKKQPYIEIWKEGSKINSKNKTLHKIIHSIIFQITKFQRTRNE